MRAAANEHNWNLNYGGIALMWRGGCIIRSVFLGKIKGAALLWGLACEAAWTVAFIIIARVAFHFGVRHYSGYGG